MDEPLLDLNDIQGHVTTGFNSDFQTLVFLRFSNDLPRTRSLFRILSQRVTTGKIAHLFRLARRLLKQQLMAEPNIDMVSVAVALTYKGLSQVASDADKISRLSAFVAGAAARSSTVNDPPLSADPGYVGNWLYGNDANPVDALVLVASDDTNAISNELIAIFGEAPVVGKELESSGATVVAVEQGADLPSPLAGHEHFGFKDGISQPGLRGRVDADTFFARRVIDSSSGQISKIDGLPGQELLWPGEIILGYPRQDDTKPENSLPAIDPPTSWMKNGSFLVYRRLRQDVESFRRFCSSVADALGVDEPTAGAKLVGRWASGAPVLRAATEDDENVAADVNQNNAFAYEAGFPAVKVRSPSGLVTIASSPKDDLGSICPRFAHVRKVNPRDISTETGNARSHRIVRRGIPYGAPYNAPDAVDRGLLFLAYQAAIEEGFENIQIQWANSSLQPQEGGHDVLIGQPDGNAARTIEVTDNNGQQVALSLPTRVVTPTAAAYLFAPSLTALSAFSLDPA